LDKLTRFRKKKLKKEEAKVTLYILPHHQVTHNQTACIHQQFPLLPISQREREREIVWASMNFQEPQIEQKYKRRVNHHKLDISKFRNTFSARSTSSWLVAK
jgi:hypothetical protein